MKNLLLRFLVCVMAGLAAASCSDDKPSYMNLSDKEISVSSDGGILTMTVTANVHYVVNHDNDWFSIVSTSNEGDATVFTIQVSANEDTSPRSGRIKFIGDDVTPKALAINQSAMVPTGVSVKKIEVEPQVTTASFTVLGEGEWTATCSNPDFVLSPSSGNGETNVTVTFSANRTAEEVKADITVTIGGQHYTVSIIQAAVDLNIITEWAFDKSVSEYSETWGNGNFDKTKAGFIDSYANASTGSGTIRFYNSDKSDRPDDGKGMRVQTGGHGDIIVRGIVTTDYWLIECSNPMLGEIPANKQMRFEFTGHIFSGCAAYWMCEYLDGNEWKPLMAPKTTTLTATQGTSGATGNWTETFTYNFQYTKDSAYQLFEGTFQMQNTCGSVKIRLRPATEIAYSGKYIDQILQQAQSRFSAQHPHEGDKAVKEYNQTVKLEFVK